MKSYTNLKQSKKLAEILPIESADLWWNETKKYPEFIKTYHEYLSVSIPPIPCWSLAALVSILPNNEHITTTISRGSWKIDTIEYMPNTWWCEYEDTKNPAEYFNTSADNPVDACADMIIKLHERKML
jgi:hypothetical protein